MTMLNMQTSNPPNKRKPYEYSMHQTLHQPLPLSSFNEFGIHPAAGQSGYGRYSNTSPYLSEHRDPDYLDSANQNEQVIAYQNLSTRPEASAIHLHSYLFMS